MLPSPIVVVGIGLSVKGFICFVLSLAAVTADISQNLRLATTEGSNRVCGSCVPRCFPVGEHKYVRSVYGTEQGGGSESSFVR